MAASSSTRRHLCRIAAWHNDLLCSCVTEISVATKVRALLTLHFADVRPEEWTPSYGGNASRMDFLLKPEQVVVEAKMARKSLGQKELVRNWRRTFCVINRTRTARPSCALSTIHRKMQQPYGAGKLISQKKHGGLQVIVIV